MKYIRTKDGKLFDTEYEPLTFKYNWNAKFIIDDNNLIVYDTVFKDRIANHGQILKQADTIEELCDEFVSVFKDNDKFVETDFQMAQDRFTGLKGIRKPTACYGAIWTDKGLIYVAKMNEDGNLCLL